MTAVIFTGPTLSAAEVHGELDALCLPPAAQGDVYRAALDRPAAIGIIDGYFENVPSIWHKEILWAMSQGIHVFGSASMGALRAAELESFGMIGIGAVFEAYRDGTLEDDDEVAVAHASAEHGYRALSDAMVNIRATLAGARAEHVIGDAAAQTLLTCAKALFYPDRSFPHILDFAARGQAPAEWEALRRWLPAGRVDQKRQDALAMIRAVREFLAGAPAPKRVSYHFEVTHYWEDLLRMTDAPAHHGSDALVLDQLRRDPAWLARATDAALGWSLAAQRAWRERTGVDAVTILGQSEAFCRAHGLARGDDVQAWLARHQLTRQGLDRLLEASALASAAREAAGAGLESVLLDYLRWTGDYAILLDRARR